VSSATERVMRCYPAFLILALVLLVVRAGDVWPPKASAEDGGSAGTIAQTVATSYRTDRQTAAFRTGLSSADTAATTLSDANLASCGEFDLGTAGTVGAARKTISLTPYFSVAGATVSVTVYTAYKADPAVATYTGVKRQGPVTFTAASSAVRGARYLSETQFFDSTGANVAFFVISTATSSGTVDLWCGSN
jgi:hypothetical protein